MARTDQGNLDEVRVVIEESNFELALKKVNEFLAREPENPEAWVLAASIHLAREKYTDCINAWTRISEFRGDKFEKEFFNPSLRKIKDTQSP